MMDWHVKAESDSSVTKSQPQEKLEPCLCAGRFAHDAVRQRNLAYIASTGDGCIVELELPACKLVHRHHLFAPKDHINALAPVGNASMWVLLHNRGEVGTCPPAFPCALPCVKL